MLENLWFLMLVMGFLCLFLSIFLFFVWRVPDLISELSGKKARKNIQVLKDLNSSSGSFGSLSTSEVFNSIPSGSLLAEELDSIKEEFTPEVGDKNFKKDEDDEYWEEVTTSELSDSKNTSYMDFGEDETTFVEGEREAYVEKYVIEILEEQYS